LAQNTHNFQSFETSGGVCAIAWNDSGIRLFQLPAGSADATVRNLLRRLPDAKMGKPPPGVSDAIVAAKRCFDGEKIEFSDFVLDPAQHSMKF
jgi:methylated-DNA-[protein]-cysteine S-methyltransferase